MTARRASGADVGQSKGSENGKHQPKVEAQKDRVKTIERKEFIPAGQRIWTSLPADRGREEGGGSHGRETQSVAQDPFHGLWSQGFMILFTLLLWLLSALSFAGLFFLLGRAVGFVIRIYDASDFLPRPYARRIFEGGLGGIICGVIFKSIDDRFGISIVRETPSAIFYGLVLVGFMAGYVHDRWVHDCHEREKESQSEEGLSWVETCDCSVCEHRRRRQATRKRR